MKKTPVDPFTILLPHLDLHSETKESSAYLIDTFIKDNYLMKSEKVVIIHGKGNGILKKKVQEVLSKNKLVKAYNIDPINDGQTIVSIKNVTKS